MALQTFEAACFPEAHARMVAFAGSEVDAVDVVLSGHIKPAGQKPGAAAFALRARQEVHVDMARKLKIMENEKHPLDDLKNDEITKKREK